MFSSWFTLFWPVLKELFANIKESPELQQRDKKGSLAKTIIVLLFVAIIAIGDMALDAHSELQKAREKLNEPKAAIMAPPPDTSAELRLELMVAKQTISTLSKDNDDLTRDLEELKMSNYKLSIEKQLLEAKLAQHGVAPDKPKSRRRVSEELDKMKRRE